MALVNLTPHGVSIVAGDRTIVVPPSGSVARVSDERAVVGALLCDGAFVPVVSVTRGRIEGLPEPVNGVEYVVSGLVLAALAGSGRVDVFAPDTSAEGAVRDAGGRIVGVRALVRYSL